MDCIPDIEQAATDLAVVADAGLLQQLKESIGWAMRGRPRNDFEAHPGLRHEVDAFGGLLAEWTGLPLALCKLAALNQLLPSNRSRVALEILREFADNILETNIQERASTILAAERRRIAS